MGGLSALVKRGNSPITHQKSPKFGIKKPAKREVRPAIEFGGSIPLGNIDRGVFTVLAAVNDGQAVPAGALVEHEGPVGELQFHDRILLVHGSNRIIVLMENEGFGIELGLRGVIESCLVEVALVQMADGLIAMWTLLLEEARLVFAHAARNFVCSGIESGVHVLALCVGLNGDVIGTKEDDFSNVPVFLNVQNRLGLNDARVIQMETLDLASGMFSKGIGHGLVSHSDGDRQIDVSSLHDVLWFWFQRQGQ